MEGNSHGLLQDKSYVPVFVWGTGKRWMFYNSDFFTLIHWLSVNCFTNFVYMWVDLVRRSRCPRLTAWWRKHVRRNFYFTQC